MYMASCNTDNNTGWETASFLTCMGNSLFDRFRCQRSIYYCTHCHASCIDIAHTENFNSPFFVFASYQRYNLRRPDIDC